MSKILVIDEDERGRDTMRAILEQENFIPILAEDAISAFEKVRAHAPQLLLVDLPLPETNGLELCKRLRASRIHTPIIFLDGRCDEIGKIMLLESGADDCISKPFSMRELAARIRAILRRTAYGPEQTFRFADVHVDTGRRIVRRSGNEIKITPAEYNLLLYFLENAGRTLSRDAILNVVWGYDWFPTTRTVDAHVVRLRQKLEPVPAAPQHFLTVHGVGYRFVS